MKTRLQVSAYNKINAAIKARRLIPLPSCELCSSQEMIVSHHHLGYQYPLDVWWICKRCNAFLEGKHDGVLSKVQARLFVQGHTLVYNWVKQEPVISSAELYRRIADSMSGSNNLLE